MEKNKIFPLEVREEGTKTPRGDWSPKVKEGGFFFNTALLEGKMLGRKRRSMSGRHDRRTSARGGKKVNLERHWPPISQFIKKSRLDQPTWFEHTVGRDLFLREKRKESTNRGAKGRGGVHWQGKLAKKADAPSGFSVFRIVLHEGGLGNIRGGW